MERSTFPGSGLYQSPDGIGYGIIVWWPVSHVWSHVTHDQGLTNVLEITAGHGPGYNNPTPDHMMAHVFTDLRMA